MREIYPTMNRETDGVRSYTSSTNLRVTVPDQSHNVYYIDQCTGSTNTEAPWTSHFYALRVDSYPTVLFSEGTVPSLTSRVWFIKYKDDGGEEEWKKGYTHALRNWSLSHGYEMSHRDIPMGGL